jgi:hypothetical protein
MTNTPLTMEEKKKILKENQELTAVQKYASLYQQNQKLKKEVKRLHYIEIKLFKPLAEIKKDHPEDYEDIGHLLKKGCMRVCKQILYERDYGMRVKGNGSLVPEVRGK